MPPRLCVLVSVDQLAAWVYAQGVPHFAADGGFRRLAADGVTFAACAYEHACTETGPGHATIGTGAPASVHGIAKNAWWDRGSGKSVYCVSDDGEAFEELPEGARRGPGRLRVPTLADAFKGHVHGSRVASIAWKDRAAILMAGRGADVAAWFDTQRGMLVTNKNWCEQLPDWLTRFNADRVVDSFFGTTWQRVGADAAYEGLVDDRPYEAVHPNGKRSRALPQVVDGGIAAPGTKYYSQLYGSPFGNTLVRHAAEAALRGMQLGQDDVPDLLCISFSATDVIGHMFGPDSVEARDALLRLDQDLGALFRTFDEVVGEGRWSVFVTADHGVAPTPEWVRANGGAAGRGPINTWVRSAVEAALRRELGDPAEGRRYVAHVGDNAVYLDHTLLRDPGVAIARVAAEAAASGRGVQCAYASADVRRDHDHPDPVRRALAYGMVAGQAGDVQFVLEPYWLQGGTPGAHGSPHAYDREVVGFAMGAGIRAGTKVFAPITPGYGVVLFAHLLDIPRPSAAAEPLYADVFVR